MTRDRTRSAPAGPAALPLPCPPCRAALPPLALACALLGAAPAALAQAQPYSLRATQAFTHDSNLFREPEGGAVRSDTVSSTGVTLGLDQPLGRQRLSASASLAANRFREFSELDNTSQGLNLRLDWETVARLSGNVRFNRSRRLADYSETRAGAAVGLRNLVTVQELAARAQFGGASLLVLEGHAARREQRYSAPQFAGREVEQDSLGAGIRYRPSDLLDFGLSLTYTDGRNPNLTAGGLRNDYERKDLSLTANWRPSGLTAVNGRISRTTTDHSLATARDFSGTTGALGVEWRPGGRTVLGLQLSRETSDESAFETVLDPVPDDGDPDTPPVGPVLVEAPLVDSRLSNTLRLRAGYAVSAKLTLDAGLSHSRRRLEDAVLAGGGASPVLVEGRDRTTALRIGASYAVNRALSLGCGLGRERRSSETAGAATAPFSATTASCQAQLTLR